MRPFELYFAKSVCWSCWASKMRTIFALFFAMVGVVLLTTSVVANATMPFMDFIEYEGSRSEAWPSNGLWLELQRAIG